jgi:hypothetical protein
VGLELGADMSATITLDDFMVFERNEERARNFFLGPFYKHLIVGANEVSDVDGLGQPADIVRLGFTDTRAFDEPIRAAEGVPPRRAFDRCGSGHAGRFRPRFPSVD